MLNCMPNRDGLLDTTYINLLEGIGKEWTPNSGRAPLNLNEKRLIYSLPVVKATTTSGVADYLIDAEQYKVTHKHWVSNEEKQQTITLDLGKTYKHIDLLTIVPNHKTKPKPETALKEGNILACKVYASTDNTNFTEVANNTWEENAFYRSVKLKETPARYFKIEVEKFIGSNAIIAEIELGSSYVKPKAVTN